MVLYFVEHKQPVHVLAISGSLREASSNTALLTAAVRLAPADIDVSLFSGLAGLPPFNPDVDQMGAPEPIVAFRNDLDACDAVLISSPEYAHGVPGVLKNALDWIVASGELMAKPVGVINASPRSTHAWTSLVETLTVMSARVIREASVTVPLPRNTLDAAAIAADDDLADLLTTALATLAAVARRY